LLLIGSLVAACHHAPPEPAPEPPHTTQAAAKKGRVETLKADAGDVAAIVKSAREKAVSEGRDLIVYVGAPWCEPCTRFHEAAAAGKLDSVFPTLRLLEFNLDVDRERLAQAGYSSRMIPLFVAPKADGTASDARMEGSIKGDGAVAEITPRLRALLSDQPR
jgi:hypothetical protein